MVACCCSVLCAPHPHESTHNANGSKHSHRGSDCNARNGPSAQACTCTSHTSGAHGQPCSGACSCLSLCRCCRASRCHAVSLCSSSSVMQFVGLHMQAVSTMSRRTNMLTRTVMPQHRHAACAWPRPAARTLFVRLRAGSAGVGASRAVLLAGRDRHQRWAGWRRGQQGGWR